MPVSNFEQEWDVTEWFQLAEHPTATFTVWQMDLSQASSRPVNTLSGDILSTLFSPDGSRVAFRTLPDGSGQPVLQIADLQSGQILRTVGENTCCLEWGPDSTRFLYIEGQDFPYEGTGSVYLGEVGGEPVLISDVEASVAWVDTNRFLLLGETPQLVTINQAGVQTITIWPEPFA